MLRRWMSSPKIAQNPARKGLTPTTKKIFSMEIVVDKMHIASHTEKWCLENCDARTHPDLKLKKVG